MEVLSRAAGRDHSTQDWESGKHQIPCGPAHMSSICLAGIVEPWVPAGEGLGQMTTLGSLRCVRRRSSKHVAETGAVLPAASPNPPRPHMEMRLPWHSLPGTTQLLEKCICKN